MSVVTGCSLVSGGSNRRIETTIGVCSPTPCVKVAVAALPDLSKYVSDAALPLIENELRRVLYAPLDVETDEPSQANILKELSERYAEFKEISDAPIDWSLQREVKVLFNDTLLIAIEVSNEGYLGGAHGFKERTLMTFRSQTGARLSISDIVEESSQRMLAKVVEAEFRRVRLIASEQTLQSAGFFLLPGQEMPLGENFALTNKGLEIQYNPYEIAPYALGETRVHVPKEAMEMLVKSDIRGIFLSQRATETR